MIIDYLRLALKNISRRGLRSWLTMLGIFIGIAAVVSLISLGQGLQNAVVSQFQAAGGDKLVFQNANTGFGPPGSLAVSKLTTHDVKAVKRVRGVGLVIPRLIRITTVKFNDKTKFNYVGSIPSVQEEINSIYEGFSQGMLDGRFLKAGDRGKVVIGGNYAEESTFGQIVRVGNRININGKQFDVVGILKKTGSFQNDDTILMMEDDVKSLLDIRDEYDLISITVAPGYEPRDVAIRLENAIRQDRNEKKGEEDFSVQTPGQVIESFSTILNAVTGVLVGIAIISLIVGGVGIANTMYTSVLERTKEIGIMKSIGARNSDIFYLFLFDAGILGLGGGIIGVSLGTGMSKLVEVAGQSALGSNLLKADTPWVLIFGALAFSVIVGAISGILPALQASRLNPVDALRKGK